MTEPHPGPCRRAPEPTIGGRECRPTSELDRVDRLGADPRRPGGTRRALRVARVRSAADRGIDAGGDRTGSRTAGRQPRAADDNPVPATPTIWEQMGGPMGMVDSGLPVVVFIVANAIGGLGWGIGAALAAARADRRHADRAQAAGDPGHRRRVRRRYRRVHRLPHRLRQGLLPAGHLELPAVRRRAAAVHAGPVAADRRHLGGHQRARHGVALGQASWSAATTWPRSSGCWCSPPGTWCRTTSTTPIRWAGWRRSGC